MTDAVAAAGAVAVRAEDSVGRLAQSIIPTAFDAVVILIVFDLDRIEKKSFVKATSKRE